MEKNKKLHVARDIARGVSIVGLVGGVSGFLLFANREYRLKKMGEEKLDEFRNSVEFVETLNDKLTQIKESSMDEDLKDLATSFVLDDEYYTKLRDERITDSEKEYIKGVEKQSTEAGANALFSLACGLAIGGVGGLASYECNYLMNGKDDDQPTM